MRNDQPPKKPAITTGPLPLRQVRDRADMTTPQACQCFGSHSLELELAEKTLRSGWVSAETVLRFRKSLRQVACDCGRISIEDYQATLGCFAYSPVWGPSRNQSLPEAAAQKLAWQMLGANASTPAELLHCVVNVTDQAVGRLGSRNVAYDPQRTMANGEVPSIMSFVLSRSRRPVSRAFDAMANKSELVDYDADMADRAPLPDAMLIIRPLQFTLSVAAAIQKEIQALELELLSLGRAALSGAPLTPTRLRNLRRAIEIAERGIEGDGGHCVILDSRIDLEDDPPPLILGTVLTKSTALEVYGSKNNTVLTDQARTWTDKVLGLVALTPSAARGRVIAQEALRLRQEMYNLLQASAEMMASLAPVIAEKASLAPIIAEKLVLRWLGPPSRDRRDRRNGQVEGVSGVGIEHLPYLFGLIDPARADTPGLDTLRSEGAPQGPHA